jgi:hypothetical protein
MVAWVKTFSFQNSSDFEIADKGLWTSILSMEPVKGMHGTSGGTVCKSSGQYRAVHIA